MIPSLTIKNISTLSISNENEVITLDDNKRFLNNGQGLLRIKKSFNNKKVRFVNSAKEDYFKVVLPGIMNFNK